MQITPDCNRDHINGMKYNVILLNIKYGDERVT